MKWIADDYGEIDGLPCHPTVEAIGESVDLAVILVPADAVTVVPDEVPWDRAVLAGTVETAVNALWDAAPLVGDRITVVGAGMVGCCDFFLTSLTTFGTLAATWS